MHALVTGSAGFIGSNLSRALLDEGWSVRGVDCFTDYYDADVKRANVAPLMASPEFELVDEDLALADLAPILDGIDVVFHQAGQPGVRLSWAEGFRTYTDLNINVTQRLLEAVRTHPVARFVFASSSSVYGNAPSYPTTETDPITPHSPYGVTKLAAELLCRAYAHNFGVPTVSLRYFTVYGPGQRPDMAIHRMIEAALNDGQFTVFGDGSQIRDFTYVGDIVRANILAATTELEPGEVLNLAGGSSTTVTELLRTVTAACGQEVPIVWSDPQPGDVQRTGGSVERAGQRMGWRPEVSLRTGIEAQVSWHRQRI